ncbi:MAG: hypothetical protein M3Q14_03810 [bacterium]|nr:hypothetical protein [bacterium]
MKTNNLILYIIWAGLILLIPFVAMQFTDGVEWGLFDFVVIGTLIIGTGLVYDLATSKLNRKYWPAIATVLIAALLLVWAELAVGVFGTTLAGS